MKHRGLKFLSLLLTLVVLLGVLPGVTAWAEDPPTNGNCGANGDNVKWSYDTTNDTLTISGTGAMADYANPTDVPWYQYRRSVQSVEINGDVTSICRFAFYDISHMTSVIIPSSVTSIGDYAFYYCSDLTSVSILGSVTSIGAWEFSFCPKLTSISIPGSVTSISGYAFSYCPKLTSISIPGSVTSIGEYAFSSCDNLASISIPGSVRSIGEYAFSNCVKLASITFEPGTDSRLSISQYAFSSIDSTAQFGPGSAELRDGNGNKIETFDALADMLRNSAITVNRELAGYTVSFKPNGGSGTMADVTVSGDYPLPACGFTPPDGMRFKAWSLADIEYAPRTSVNITHDTTFKAVWEDASGSGGGSGSMVDLVFNIPGVDNSWEYAPGYATQQAYRVSLAPMQGGSAALGLTTGDSGTALNVYPTSAVYVFPNADPGYTLDKIVWSLIDGSASYDITEAKNFVMPAMDVVVYVTFRPVG